jgi:hypothetical protein
MSGQKTKWDDTTIARVVKGIIVAVVLVAVAILLYVGFRETEIAVLDDGIEIKAAYGPIVPYADITDIVLHEESMNTIGTGERTNGFGDVGQTLKGNFHSETFGDTLLFVQANTAPTIQINRSNGERTIFISFKDSEATRMLYAEIASFVHS